MILLDQRPTFRDQLKPPKLNDQLKRDWHLGTIGVAQKRWRHGKERFLRDIIPTKKVLEARQRHQQWHQRHQPRQQQQRQWRPTTSTAKRKRKQLKTSLGTPERYLNWKANKRVEQNLECLSWSFWWHQKNIQWLKPDDLRHFLKNLFFKIKPKFQNFGSSITTTLGSTEL